MSFNYRTVIMICISVKKTFSLKKSLRATTKTAKLIKVLLCYCDILIFYISVILYLFVRGYKCRLGTFPTRFAHVISILRYCHCFASLKVLCHEQMNKYHIKYHTFAARRHNVNVLLSNSTFLIFLL